MIFWKRQTDNRLNISFGILLLAMSGVSGNAAFAFDSVQNLTFASPHVINESFELSEFCYLFLKADDSQIFLLVEIENDGRNDTFGVDDLTMFEEENGFVFHKTFSNEINDEMVKNCFGDDWVLGRTNNILENPKDGWFFEVINTKSNEIYQHGYYVEDGITVVKTSEELEALPDN